MCQTRALAYHEGAVRVLKGGVRRKHRVVRLNNRVRHRRCRVHAELEFRLLAVVRAQAFQDERAQSRTSATAERVEYEEALQTGAVVGQTTELVHDRVDLLLADGVMATRVWYIPP